VIPVGPGHLELSWLARDSVKTAMQRHHPWREIEIRIVEDLDGAKGRSRARNEGMAGADGWLFFLDADDLMDPDALGRNTDCDATFGIVALVDGPPVKNTYPETADELAADGPIGTLSMGFFIRADVAQSLRFNETLDVGEDWEFYTRLVRHYRWTKSREPLAHIGYLRPSAGGPRGRHEVGLDWETQARSYLQ